jgi:hypothetical protein
MFDNGNNETRQENMLRSACLNTAWIHSFIILNRDRPVSRTEQNVVTLWSIKSPPPPISPDESILTSTSDDKVDPEAWRDWPYNTDTKSDVDNTST